MTRAPLAAAAFLLMAAVPARAQEPAPKPWTPGQTQSAPAPPAAYDTLRAAPADYPLPTPAGVTRPLDLLYEPSVPDSILPLMLRYRQVPTDEVLTTYVGALRQDLPVRAYSVVLENQTVHASVDGLEGQSHLAIMLIVPWFGKIMPLPGTTVTLIAKIDDGPDQKWKLLLTPGPVFYIPAERPLPISNPALLTLPLAPGKHRVKLQIKDLDAAYALLVLAQPVLSPPAMARPR